MKQEIIYTEHYALILGDEQTKENDWGYIRFQGGDVKLIGKYFADDWLKVIAHRPLKDAPILEGVPLLPEFEDDDFLNTEIQVVGDNKTMSVSNFLKKYGKETYKYTEEDLRKAFQAGESRWGTNGLIDTEPNEDEIIQSLQPKRPKYFECETIYRVKSGTIQEHKDGLAGFEYYEPNSKLNSQGQTELVGEYIF
jgi:hypothetical protein